MRQRRRDEGGSEGRPVMGRIEGKSSRTTSPRRESGLTSLGCSVTRGPGQPTQGDKQTCRRQQCSLVRLPSVLTYGPSAPGAYREGRRKATASREGRL
jgi:hypothetical protein